METEKKTKRTNVEKPSVVVDIEKLAEKMELMAMRTAIKLKEAEKMISDLKRELVGAKKRARQVEKASLEVTRAMNMVDRAQLLDISKVYGFDGEKMYYIGVASGRMYTCKADEHTMKQILNFKNLTWQEIQQINERFMKNM